MLFVSCPGGVKGDLAKYCDKYNLDYLPFSSFVEAGFFYLAVQADRLTSRLHCLQVRDHVKSVVEGNLTVDDLVKKGRELAGRQ